MANKINVDSIILNNENLYIDEENISKIIAEGVCEINLFNSNIINLDIDVKTKSTLIINYFSLIKKRESNIKINAHNKSRVVFNHSFKNLDVYNLNIMTNFLGEEASITVNLNGLNDGGKCTLDVNGYVNTNKINNVLDENMKVVNLNNGTAVSNPNMYIDTSKVIANHNTTIGGIGDEELFYLMSKGLDKDEATKLICHGFLISKLNNEELVKRVKEII